MGKNMLSTPLYESLEIKRACDTRRIITRSLSAALWLFLRRRFQNAETHANQVQLGTEIRITFNLQMLFAQTILLETTIRTFVMCLANDFPLYIFVALRMKFCLYTVPARIITREERFCWKKILAGYRKVILLNYQNNFVERSN